MAFRYQGVDVECIELYPHVDDTGHTEAFSFTIVGRGGRTLMSDQVRRRDHQTLLSLMVATTEMVRHCCHEAT